MLLDVLLVAGGAVVLAYAGNRLVDFAVAVAEKARLTPAVIGLTIVAAGTSAPELLVSVTGALRGSPGKRCWSWTTTSATYSRWPARCSSSE